MSGDAALGELLERLKAIDYRFVAVTPATQARVLARVLARGRAEAVTLRDIFGWNRPFAEHDLEPSTLALLERADALSVTSEGLRSRVRVASLGGDLFLHSQFPTDSDDAVFFGPDSYRFARFIRQNSVLAERARLVVDMGSGSGVGGIVAARVAAGNQTILVDVNAAALRLARINAAVAGVDVETVEANRIPDGADLILANPPYMMDGARRAYRDGGEKHGGEVALDWARQALAGLRPGGGMLLYTGAAVVRGRIPLLDALEQACAGANATLAWDEIDPDVFGEELEGPAYADVERIAAIGAVLTK